MRFRKIRAGVDEGLATLQSRVLVVCDACDLAITEERPGLVWSSLEGEYLGTRHNGCGGYEHAVWGRLDEFLFAVLNPLIPPGRRAEAAQRIIEGPF